MKEIPLSKGYVALIDDEDFERVTRFKWSALLVKRKVYGTRMFHFPPGHLKGQLLHRFILGSEPGSRVDHIDGNSLNCQKANLRYATNGQNMSNRGAPRSNSSGYKGVSWSKGDKKWRACIVLDYRQYFLGNFDNKEDAARAYDDKARELHGEFARLNFP